jgi:hypothetical protein
MALFLFVEDCSFEQKEIKSSEVLRRSEYAYKSHFDTVWFVRVFVSQNWMEDGAMLCVAVPVLHALPFSGVSV